MAVAAGLQEYLDFEGSAVFVVLPGFVRQLAHLVAAHAVFVNEGVVVLADVAAFDVEQALYDEGEDVQIDFWENLGYSLGGRNRK